MESQGQNGAKLDSQSSNEELKLVEEHYYKEVTSKNRLKLVCSRTMIEYYGDKCIHVYRFRCSKRLTENCSAQITTDKGVKVILNESLEHTCQMGINKFKDLEKKHAETDRLVKSYYEQQQQKLLQRDYAESEESKSDHRNIYMDQSWMWCHECTCKMLVGALVPWNNRCEHFEFAKIPDTSNSAMSPLQQHSKKRQPSKRINDLEQCIADEASVSVKSAPLYSTNKYQKCQVSDTVILSNLDQCNELILPQIRNKDAIIEDLRKQLLELQNIRALHKDDVGDVKAEPRIVNFKVQMDGAEFEIKGNEWVVKQKN